jgi:hypothetical protein
MTSTKNEVEQALHPSLFYTRPADVVADELLTIDERRAILASWASDACAVASNPLVRQAPFTDGPVTFEEIMDALFDLDRLKISCSTADLSQPSRTQRSALAERRRLYTEATPTAAREIG